MSFILACLPTVTLLHLRTGVQLNISPQPGPSFRMLDYKSLIPFLIPSQPVGYRLEDHGEDKRASSRMLFVKQPPFPDSFVRLDGSAGSLLSLLSHLLARAVKVDQPIVVRWCPSAEDDADIDVPASFVVAMAGQLLGFRNNVMQG